MRYVPSNFELIAPIAAIAGIIVAVLVMTPHEAAQCTANGGHYVNGLVGSHYVTLCTK